MKSLFLVFLFCLVCLRFSGCTSEDDDKVNLDDFNKYKIDLYSGLLSVNSKKPELKLHYIFVKTTSKEVNAPLLVWLNGGPGCSSLLGFLEEHGPLIFKENTKELVQNFNTWSSVANVLYLESPVGVGFSEGSYNKYDDVQTSKDNLQALLEFYKRFPKYMKSKLYISGESYAGIYVPYFAKIILEHEEKINLEGILVGNGLTDPDVDMENSLVDFAYEYFLYGSELRKELDQKCEGKRPLPDTVKCNDVVDRIMNVAFPNTDKTGVGFNIYDVYRRCTPNSELIEQTHSNRHLMFPLNYYKKKFNLKLDPPCSTSVGTDWYLNRDDVKEALHVNKSIKWEMCNETVHNNYPFGSSIKLYQDKLFSKIRILIYSGDSDGAVPYHGTRQWVKSLKLQINEHYRSWKLDNTEEVAGYVQVYQGLTLVTIKGTGHMAPQWKPEEAHHMLTKFLKNEKL